MDNLDPKTAMILASVAALMGILELVFAKLIFGKKIAQLQEKHMTTASLDEQAKLEKQIKGMKIIALNMSVFGLAFLAASAYLFTR